jgi:4-amino-4-deoxy-L-arabinose transferase-like glycosyltransferase
MVTVKSITKTIDDFLPFMLIIVCVGCARFIESELIVFSVFLVTLVFYAWRRYDCRLFVAMGMILLVVCAVLLAGGMETFANQVAIWVYYFLLIGVIGLLIEYVREKPQHRWNKFKEK